MNKKIFTPQIIGQPDLKKRDGILSLADTILESVNDLDEALRILFPDSTVTFAELKNYISNFIFNAGKFDLCLWIRN